MAEMIPFGEKNEEAAQASEVAGENASPKPESAPRPIYTNEEVSEIIRMALRNAESEADNTVGHEEMLAIGRDFGLSERQLEGAFEAISQSRNEQERASKIGLAFKVHAMCFAVVVAALFTINWLTMPSLWWSVWPFICWGTVLVLHAILTRYLPTFTAKLLERISGASLDWVESNMSTGTVSSPVTFTIPDIYNSLAQASGVAIIENNEFVLEYETKDSLFGIIKSGVKEIRVPLRDIARARLTRQFWSTKLTLQSHRLKTFEDFPGHKGGTIQLIFDREARAASERLAAVLSKRIVQP